KKYIADCTTEDGGVQYSIMRQGGARPPITAAAIAAMYNSGEFEGGDVQKMLEYCERNIWPGGGGMRSTFGHWHYAHFYYSQVRYRLGDDKWERYRREIADEIVRKQSADGDRKSTRLNSSHVKSSYAVFCLKKKRRTTMSMRE